MSYEEATRGELIEELTRAWATVDRQAARLVELEGRIYPKPEVVPDGLGLALATAIEGGYSDESIDIARYTGDPIYHAVVWEIRKHRANLDGPKTVKERE